MGTRDSSRTRVAPFFGQLYERDPTGGSWFDEIIALGSRQDIVKTVPRSQRLISDHGERWGATETPLHAPQTLLEYLASHLDPRLIAGCSDTGETLRKRRELADGNATTISEAIDTIRTGERGRKWFILEGESRPDALLVGTDVVLCVEGKRTEAKCTTTTQWMRQRAQLIRHMDAATDHFPGRRILGLLLVEGNGGADAVHPSGHWLEESAASYAQSMIAGSLPHRSAAERERLVANVLGVNTWQAACRALNVDWNSLPDTVEQ